LMIRPGSRIASGAASNSRMGYSFCIKSPFVSYGKLFPLMIQ
jgi:hypothetical protein